MNKNIFTPLALSLVLCASMSCSQPSNISRDELEKNPQLHSVIIRPSSIGDGYKVVVLANIDKEIYRKDELVLTSKLGLVSNLILCQSLRKSIHEFQIRNPDKVINSIGIERGVSKDIWSDFLTGLKSFMKDNHGSISIKDEGLLDAVTLTLRESPAVSEVVKELNSLGLEVENINSGFEFEPIAARRFQEVKWNDLAGTSHLGLADQGYLYIGLVY